MSITTNFPAIRPTLSLDFANSLTVDPRITFTRASTATYFDRLGVLRTAAANEPRIDFDPVTGACRGLLIEEQRTNLLTRSQEFDNASWGKNNVTVTANAAVAPDGTLTGTKIIESSTADVTKAVAQFTPGLWDDNSQYTASLFAKAGERTILWIESRTKQPTFPQAYFDLANGIVLGTVNGAAAKIEPVGNGWYRCSITANALTGTFTPGIVFGPATISSGIIYTGDGFSGIYVWGAQLEAGTFPTSYIPTTTAQVTRARDTAFLPTSNWMTFQQGTMLFDFEQNLPVAAQTADAIYFGAYPNSALINGQDQGWTLYRGNNYLTRNPTEIHPGMGAFTGRQRVAISLDEAGKYGTKNGESVLSVLGNHTRSGTPSVFSLSGSSNTNVNQHIRRVVFYPVRLPNNQLQALTA